MSLSLFKRVVSLLGMTTAVCAADKPLAEAAKAVAPQLKAGCIVTGEKKKGKAVFALAGTAPEGTGAPEEVLFEIGSISKTFTGLLLAQTVVEKKVKLDTTIAELLGREQTFADPRVGKITLVQLSTHTSGLPRLPGNAAAGMGLDDPYARYDEKLLRAFMASAKLNRDGPFPVSYSNLGAGLLGHLLARVHGKSWEAAVVEKICQPLGLNHTRVNVADLKLPMAPPYSGATKNYNWTFDVLAGAGALRSTAGDMIKYGEAVLHPDQTPLKDAFALALRPHAESGATGGQIGLGFFVGKIDGDLTYWHDGGTGGYTSVFRVVPAREAVQVVLTNNSAVSGAAVLAAAEAKPAQPAEVAKEIKLPPEALRAFAGVYEIDQNTRFTVLLEEEPGQLWVRLSGQPFLRVFAKTPNRFFAKAVAAEFEFQQDEEGKVKALTLFQNGREMKAARTAQPAPGIILKSAEELRPYAGIYNVVGMKALTVTVRGSTLYAQLESQPPLPVFAIGPDRFEYDVVEAMLVFTRNDAREINGLTLFQNGLSLPAPRKMESKTKPKAKP